MRDLVFHPGCLLAGTERSVGGRLFSRRGLEESYAKAGL